MKPIARVGVYPSRGAKYQSWWWVERELPDNLKNGLCFLLLGEEEKGFDDAELDEIIEQIDKHDAARPDVAARLAKINEAMVIALRSGLVEEIEV